MHTAPLPPELCTLLCCPVSNEAVSFLPSESLSDLNRSIPRGGIRDIGGRLVKDKFDGGLINSSQSIVYPVRKGVPLLQSHLGVSLSGKQEFDSAVGYPQNQSKLFSEIDFWHGVCDQAHYSHANRYTSLFYDIFHLPESFFEGKNVIDIGCGPQGSLDSINNARLRVGIDPLSEGYLQFWRAPSPMHYICGVAERLPIRSETFDIVVSLNSIDHVDHIDPVIHELSRIVVRGGHVVLFTEIHEEPTVCEPIPTDWNLPKRFEGFRSVLRIETEKDEWRTFYNHADSTDRYGSLFTVLQKL